MPISIAASSKAKSADTDVGVSPQWNPEMETMAALSSSWSSVASASTYEVPSADEAFSISSSPATSCSGSLYRIGSSNDLIREAQTPPHPLTYDPAPHAAWDFDKLFSKKRRWFGGARIPYSDTDDDDGQVTDTEPSSSEDAHPEREGRSRSSRRLAAAVTGNAPPGVCAKVLLERQAAHDRDVSLQRASRGPSRSRDRTPSVQPTQHSRLCNEIPQPILEEQQIDRQQAAYEVLRATAMSRLKLVGEHLDWTANESAASPANAKKPS